MYKNQKEYIEANGIVLTNGVANMSNYLGYHLCEDKN
jgi:hypothetical protein